MIKIGITGQSGFIGTHLYNYLGLNEDIIRIPFKDEFFKNKLNLEKFVDQCDAIVHLAALNRHGEAGIIYRTNLGLIDKLLDAVENTKSKPHIIMSSSTQESRDNEYGRSKKAGRKLFMKWANDTNGKLTGLVISNVFGPFGNPFYNSFIATFSHLICTGGQPKIDIDTTVNLIYINDLVKKIYEVIINKELKDELIISHTASVTVTEVLRKLESYKESYFLNGIFPTLASYFDICLFNTFRSYFPKDYFPRNFIIHSDNRGSFVETVKSNSQGQFSYSTTKPGVTRGNHFHTRKVERFAVIQGNASIKLRKIGTQEIIEYIISGDNPAYVDMPVWYTHNITNIGEEDLVTLFWINEFYNKKNPDTFFEEV
jgi:UDP-2-acetamido-2,6-beta-L-arabino-hexul-4-ose reductase